jgi:CheY-specific phosphatase CheX
LKAVRRAKEVVQVNAQSLSRIDGFLSSSVMDLFRSHGLKLVETEYRAQGIEIPFASTIGFTSSTLSGVLVLTASRELAERSLPANLRKGGTPSDAIVADWTGELSNQTLGRLKNRFYAVGIEIALSTPTVFAGKELRHFFQASAVSRSIMFTGDGTVFVELQADCAEDLEIGEEKAGGGESATPEGEALFF